MMEAIIAALSVAERIAADHPDLAGKLVELAKAALSRGDTKDEEERAGLIEGLARAQASAVTEAMARARSPSGGNS